MAIHDPQICTCQNGKPWDMESVCSCQCAKCGEYRASMERLKRLKEIEERLKKAKIEPIDLADLVWVLLEPTVEHRIERLARDALMGLLKEIKLVSAVQWSSLSWGEPAKKNGVKP